jgi:hypothetical protein
MGSSPISGLTWNFHPRETASFSFRVPRNDRFSPGFCSRQLEGRKATAGGRIRRGPATEIRLTTHAEIPGPIDPSAVRAEVESREGSEWICEVPMRTRNAGGGAIGFEPMFCALRNQVPGARHASLDVSDAGIAFARREMSEAHHGQLDGKSPAPWTPACEPEPLGED